MSNGTRVAIVTGSSRGIGASIAHQLAKDGYDLALNDLPSQRHDLEKVLKDITHLGRRGYIVTADVSSDQEVNAMVDDVVKHFGRLDVMVANAGILSPSSLVETSVAQWDNVMSVNARGVFLCYKYAARAMIAGGRGGRIIGAASLAAKQAVVYAPAYSASKFAVRGLTQSAAQELGKYSITVNAYAPVPIPENPDEDTRAHLEARKIAEIAKTPVGRLGQPGEVAHLVSYLASENSAFVIGQTISINGGQFFD
ncbi:NAD(P)-binding protein [Macrolepiota fuliginosa MF-IS2]|uniref:NAD(P)-binding protein n=1 Tax=Macrolepiota fuliginosa MF-IS2 TaxID=1400762 RepID=A0A9P6C3S0_9AGAR|nr:NAD(P)-binding protein [Macrolepiota fuliginosa MF-IS2]